MGDGAKKDIDGDLWVMGRVNDVMNVSGHRLTTTEIEQALVSHPSVSENRPVGDVTTLADSTVMDAIKVGLAAGTAD